MFLLRSAFWLTLAFLVIKPGVDFHATATTLSDAAMNQGGRFVAEQIAAIECDSLHCFGGKAMLSATFKASPSAVLPKYERPAGDWVPLPRARPDRAG